jgi:hypothetical protein
MVGEEVFLWDLDYHRRVPYVPDASCPIHRWYLINESQSICQARDIFLELGIAPGDLVIDPFSGSGTIALQSSFAGVDFLGYERLAACVVGSRAKLAARHIRPDTMVGWVKTQNRCNQSHTALEEFGRLHQAILQDCNNPEGWVLAACLYSSMYVLGSSATALELHQRFAHNVYEASYDISQVSFQADLCEMQRVIWGSGTDVDWQLASDRAYRRVFLITSPPFPLTSQNDTKVWRICESAAQNLLSQRGETPVGYNITPSITSNDLYFDLTKAVLHQLRAFRAELVAVLECECPVVKCTPSENLDSRVCRMAATLGFGCKVRITHYVESPGVICQNETSIRGSLIYLNRKLEDD